jgi:hypothetical protein
MLRASSGGKAQAGSEMALIIIEDGLLMAFNRIGQGSGKLRGEPTNEIS